MNRWTELPGQCSFGIRKMPRAWTQQFAKNWLKMARWIINRSVLDPIFLPEHCSKLLRIETFVKQHRKLVIYVTKIVRDFGNGEPAFMSQAFDIASHDLIAVLHIFIQPAQLLKPENGLYFTETPVITRSKEQRPIVSLPVMSNRAGKVREIGI